MNEESKQGIADLHNFWQKERAGLFYFLTGNFPYLFDEKQLHITQDDLESALGLYILLKTKVCIIEPVSFFHSFFLIFLGQL